MITREYDEMFPNLSRRNLLRGAAGVAGAAAVGGLAGCGSNTGRGSGSGTTIKQWYHEYGEAGVLQAVKRYAKAYKKADVEVQWTPGDYDSKLASGLLSNAGPDVFEAQPKADEVKAGQLVDLTDVIAGVKDDFAPGILQSATIDGKVYGIPQAIDMQLLFYRKSLLSAAKLDVPTTLDELASAAKKLTTRKVKGLFLGNDGGASVLGALPLWSVGQDFLTSDGKKVGFDAATAAPALAKLRQIYSSGSLLLGAPADWSDPSAFNQGLTAMQWSGLWAIPAVRKALGDDFGVAAWPALSSSVGKQSVPIGAFCSCVSSKSKHVADGKAFVKWLWIDQTADQLDFNQSYGFHIPPRKSISAKATKLKTGAAADAVRFTQEIGKPASPPAWTAAMGTAWQDGLNKVIRSGADPTATLRDAITKVDTELARLNK
jgi:multiple sugar transport system substrate-binding protein